MAPNPTMSALSLRESVVSRDPDFANEVKLSIESINARSLAKSMWLHLFASFRILRNLYANPDTKSTGLRLLSWSNLFDSLHQRPTCPFYQPANPATASHDEVFSIQKLEKYSGDVLQVLVGEAFSILRRNGGQDAQVEQIKGLFEEVRRDFESILEIEKAG